jgi:hypothetical protein
MSSLTGRVLALFDLIGLMSSHLERRNGCHGLVFLGIDGERVLFAALLVVPEDMPVQGDGCLFLRVAYHPFLPEIRTHPRLAGIACHISVPGAHSRVEACQALQ